MAAAESASISGPLCTSSLEQAQAVLVRPSDCKEQAAANVYSKSSSKIAMWSICRTSQESWCRAIRCSAVVALTAVNYVIDLPHSFKTYEALRHTMISSLIATLLAE